MAVKTVWGSVLAFKLFVLDEHFCGAGIAMFSTIFPFFLQHALQFGKQQSSLGLSIIMLATGACVIAGAPLAALLNRRVDPSRLIAAASLTMGLSVLVGTLLALALQDNFHYTIAVLAFVSGLGGGFACAIYFMTRVIVLTFIIDDDQVTRARKTGLISLGAGTNPVSGSVLELPERRDGLFVAVTGSCGIAAQAWMYVVSVLLSLVAFDPDREREPVRQQPEAVRHLIIVLTGCVVPVLMFLHGFLMLAFPLRSERLCQLRKEYGILYSILKSDSEVDKRTQEAGALGVDNEPKERTCEAMEDESNR